MLSTLRLQREARASQSRSTATLGQPLHHRRYWALKKITYPGANNKTEMTYGPTGGRAKIVETVSGSVTSTKQFIGGEERDGSGNVTKQFFSEGQRNGSSNLFYGRDHLGSIRTTTDNSGIVQASYRFNPFGQVSKLEGAGDSDFQYAGMYIHSRSGLNLAAYRAYSPAIGRWINRDPIEEDGGVNLYGYVENDPINLSDPLGLVSKQCQQAKDNVASALDRLKKRKTEQECGRTDKDVVKKHQKAFKEAQNSLNDALRRWAIHCPKDDLPPQEAIDFANMPAPVPNPPQTDPGNKRVPPPPIMGIPVIPRPKGVGPGGLLPQLLIN